MRTTLSIDDQLVRELKARASRANIPVTRLVNQVLRAGLMSLDKADRPQAPYKEQVIDMGEAAIDLNKGLEAAAHLENEELLRKVDLRK